VDTHIAKLATNMHTGLARLSAKRLSVGIGNP
jgi:hypothetical protein